VHILYKDFNVVRIRPDLERDLKALSSVVLSHWMMRQFPAAQIMNDNGTVHVRLIKVVVLDGGPSGPRPTASTSTPAALLVKTYYLSVHSPELGNYILPLLLQRRQSWGRRGSSRREHVCHSRREHRRAFVYTGGGGPPALGSAAGSGGGPPSPATGGGRPPAAGRASGGSGPPGGGGRGPPSPATGDGRPPATGRAGSGSGPPG
uniref:Uncharacterized protein n=1 Tax=Amphimedon queenslandica TaxID=400682 RepID=A0A1X7SN71_AMPQE